MHVNLLFGFLGAGKTTLVRRLLGELGREQKTAVIVNEFGEVGVDGKILQGGNVDIIELTSGCLCCTLKGSLILALEELHERSGVERVIVEATGVAQPGEMIETLSEPDISVRFEIGRLVTVIDAAKFPKFLPMLGAFYAAQIQDVDILIVNKADLVTPEQLEQVGREARALNPHADILFADQGDVDSGFLLRGTFSGRRGAQAPAENQDQQHGHRHAEQPDHGHDAAPAESFVLVPAADGVRAGVAQFFAGLPDNVWRAKGFMRIDGRPSLVQYAMGQLEISPATAECGEKVVFIGRDMNRARIETQFASLGRTP